MRGLQTSFHTRASRTADLKLIVPHGGLRGSGAIAQERSALPSSYCIKLLIVDKERSVRSAFTELCRRVTHLQVLGEAESGRAALEAAQSLSPDVMLIDVNLPDMSGFDVLRLVSTPVKPLGIMTSHQTDNAARAIAEGAVDYLVKPVNGDRFDLAIERARHRYILEEAAEALSTQQILRRLDKRPRFLVGERQHRLHPLDIEKIDYIEADGNYVTIRAGGAEYISRGSIKRLAAELADMGFLRIDRSILLNVRAVLFAEPIGHGALAFTLSSGVCLHSSKTYREAILEVLPWHHCRGGAG